MFFSKLVVLININIMKTKELSLIIILGFCINTFSQVEWAPIGAKWYFNNVEGYDPPSTGYVTIESIGDTLLIEKLAKIMKITYFSSDGIIHNLGFEYTYQDNNKIFYYKNGKYYLLYDFGAVIGDTLKIYSNKPNGCGFDTIGTIKIRETGISVINNDSLRFYEVIPVNNSIWTINGKIFERIGSMQYMFPLTNNICGLMDYIEVGGLRCYTDSDFGIYKTVNYPCDTLMPYKTNIEYKPNQTINIFPNPVDDYLNIIITSKSTINLYLSIHNLLGVSLINNLINNDENKIDISLFNEGIYILKIIDSDGNLLFLKRIIKI